MREVLPLRLMIVISFAWLTPFHGWCETRAGLSWQSLSGHRVATVNPPAAGRTGFSLMSSRDTGINFSNLLWDATVARNQIYLLGSGVGLGDVDNDGWCDLYACNLEGRNALYRNLGNWRFQETTTEAIACPGQFSTGTVFADLDKDGDLDLLVNAIGGGTRCFLNDGTGAFKENAEAGFLRRLGATSLALADVEGDGDLDVYVANYRTTTIRSTGLQVMVANGRRVLRPEDREGYSFTPEGLILEHGEPDFLYLNDGTGNFSVLSWAGGDFRDEDGNGLTAGPKDWSLSAMFRDMNGDGAPDLYVCNDFQSPDRIWLNDGRGGFNAIPRVAVRQISTFSMGVDFADLDRDGQDDFVVLDMLSRDHARRMRQKAMTLPITAKEDRPQVERNTAFRNRGDGSYAEMAYYAGLHASEWSWGIVFLDVDLDGFEDALITTGHGFDTQDSDTERRITSRGKAPGEKVGENILQYPRLHIPNVAFRNRGNWSFEEVGAAWGFNQTGVSHGIATADLDNDGDLDVIVNNLNAALGVYRNHTSAPRIAIRAKEIGARIRLSDGQSQEVIGGGRYLSCDEGLRVFAAPRAANIDVIWRNGMVSRIQDAQPNRIYEVDSKHGAASTSKTVENVAAIFKDVGRDFAFTNTAKDTLEVTHSDFLKGFPERTAAVFADLTGDGAPELVIAQHWQPVRVLEYKSGKFLDVTDRRGLSHHTGFWNGVAVGDFDSDGRLDIAASNWGRNSHYQEFLKDEWRGWFDGTNLIVEGYVDPTTKEVVPAVDMETLAQRIPSILERFSTAARYGEASLNEVLGEEKRKLRERRVRWLDSTIFLNRGERFEARSLPLQAQLAPAFDLRIADINNDGHEDLFLAHNSDEADAGCSLWLLGDGRGNFEALSARESGIAVYGKAPESGLVDVNSDGRIDLILDHKLYENTSAKQGVSITAHDAVGATVRVVYDDALGPVRQISTGPIAREILGFNRKVNAVRVRWRNGNETTHPVSSDLRVELRQSTARMP